MIIALRTDNPQAEIYLYQDGQCVGQEIWQAHRELSSTILLRIKSVLDSKNLSMQDLSGIIYYEGPGSFTGLRIGASVANALGAGLAIPVVGARGENWRQDGLKSVSTSSGFAPVEPFYGAEANITPPKK